VIALYGPWGSGKSSIKNIVLESLRSRDPEDGAVRIAEFNAWQVANRDQLSRAFFDQVGLALGRSTNKQRSRRAARWHRYAAYLRSGTDIVSVVRTPLAVAMALFALAILGLEFVQARAVAIIVSIAFLVLAALLRWSARFAEASAPIRVGS
jgi:Cdc6-like AAA superfamily ATPase